ncbi:hypothetical protein Goarm_022171 [Gossypium armourianum]|uniref:Uncharacterized protein n=1 Tax=Gossypium armourianum TaxID=34283 RepID=A0A7J9KI42_9ROSI|nr:hypothetical protein [Gossypium armourianum]
MILAVGPITTPEYIKWWGRRINDNISRRSQGNSQPTGKHLRDVPSELEIIMQDFERRNLELEENIEQMEEEKMNLRLDMDVHNLETEKLRKRKNKSEGDLDSLKTDYKKLRFSVRTVRLNSLKPVKSVRKNGSTFVRTKLEIEITLWERLWLRFERNMMAQLTQLLAGIIEKGKSPMINPGEDNEERLYPPGFTLPNIQDQAEMYPWRPSVTIRPQQSQARASMPINF